MRVLIVDDDELIRRSWQRVLARPELHVVTLAGIDETSHALDSADSTYVDVALVDLFLEDGTGLDLVPMIRRRCPAARVALISAHLDASASLAALAEGVVAVPKPLDASTLCTLVELLSARGAKASRVGRLFPQLSRRELQVVELCVAGLGSQAIATMLGVSRRTVDEFWQRIFKKTNLGSERELLAWVSRRLAAELDLM